MPNWCFTNYAIYGDEKPLRSLYNKMKRLEKRKESLLPNGFGKNWLGNLVKRLGGNPNSVYCRGDWTNLKFDHEDGFPVLRFDTQTAWSRMDEVESLIESYHEDRGEQVSIFFLSEELGNGIFETNDEKGDVFPEQVIVDDEEVEMNYFTEEAAIEYLAAKALDEGYATPILTWKDAVDFAELRNDTADEEETETHIWLHKAELAA